MQLTQLTITAWRNQAQWRLQSAAPGVLLHGHNGAGKTNVLEAISLFSPGNGLRQAQPVEFQQQNNPQPWGIVGGFSTCTIPHAEPVEAWDASTNTSFDTRGMRDTEFLLRTGRMPHNSSRIIYQNDTKLRSQLELANIIALLWLTPAMIHLWRGGSKPRRQFLDRLVFGLDPAHAARVKQYESLLQQRLKLLTGNRAPDPEWLTALEAQAAPLAADISFARAQTITALQAVLDAGACAPFPIPRLHWEDPLFNALDYTENLKQLWQQQRGRDAASGRTTSGPQRGGLQAIFAPTGQDAAVCSTGEQTALLIAIALAFAHVVKAKRQMSPLLLIDDLLAHLDAGRQQALWAACQQLNAQLWLTHTEIPGGFPADYLTVEMGKEALRLH